MNLPFRFTDSDGREVQIIGPSGWSESYYAVLVDGVPSCRPASLVLQLITHPIEGDAHMARARTKEKDTLNEEIDVTLAATSEALELKDPDLSVDDDVKENTPEENAAVVAKATDKSTTAKKDDAPKEKAPSTAEVAGLWIKAQLEEEPRTKEELVALAAESNPAKYENPKGKDRPKVPRSTKWIVENKKIGTMCPGNASGHYVSEGLDSRKGGVDVLIDEESKKLRLK